MIKFSDDTDDIQLLNQAITTLEKVNTKDFIYAETLTEIWKISELNKNWIGFVSELNLNTNLLY